MPVVNYHTVNGQMVGQSTGTEFTQYLTDALGSVTATVNGKRVTNTYRYKPYGERLAKTGSGPDPAFQWAGDTGSRVTGRSWAEQYNQARHYGTRQSSWTSVDPIWPKAKAFVYVGSNPIRWLDPTGLYKIEKKDCGGQSYIEINPIGSVGGVIGIPIDPPIGPRFYPKVGKPVKDFDPRIWMPGLVKPGSGFVPGWGLIPGTQCVCTNGSYLDPKTGFPIGPVKYPGCGSDDGRNFSPSPGWEKVWIGDDYIGAHPDGALNAKRPRPRTAACVDPSGKVSRMYVIGLPGLIWDDFKQCLDCPPPNVILALDSGTSTLLIEFGCDGNSKFIVPGGYSKMPNLICFCKPCG